MAAPVRLAVQTPHEELRAVIVPMLEELLERARRGELESLLLLYETTDEDSMHWSSAGTLNRSQTLGRIEILKSKVILDAMLEPT